MLPGSHTCVTCEAVFAHRSALKDHIKQIHQGSVKVTFTDGTTASIKRDHEGVFKCMCGRVFTLPGSARRHAKRCDGRDDTTVTTAADDEGESGTMEEREEEGEEEGGEDMMDDLSYDLVSIHSSHMSADRS